MWSEYKNHIWNNFSNISIAHEYDCVCVCLKNGAPNFERTQSYLIFHHFFFFLDFLQLN